MGDRLLTGTALEGLLPGPLPVGYGLLHETCLRIVMRQQFGLGYSGLWELGFEHLPNPLMVLLPCAFQE